MKVSILETGTPPGNLAEEFGSYGDMFERLLGREFEAERFDVQARDLPHPTAYPAYLITGSPAGVYDPLPWIAPLMQFIRSAADSRMVGVCFGHQVMAEALGGKVLKSDKGWGVGLHRYAVVRQEPWLDDAGPVDVPASHQDQVVARPPGTEVVAQSDFTPFAGLSWTDRAAISFQFHPEFSPEFAKALIERRYDRVPQPEAAIASLDALNDNERVGGWIRNFLKGQTR